MRLSYSRTVVILVFFWFCVITTSGAASLGEPCNDTITCENTGEECDASSMCVCDTGYGEYNGECKLSSITVSLSGPDSSIIYGSSTNLTANITSVDVTAVAWQKVGSGGSVINITIDSTKYTQTDDLGSGNTILTINNLNYTDEGSYQVQVTNSLGETNISNPVVVDVPGDPPSVSVSGPTQSGDSVTIGCNATVTPDSPSITAIKWTKDGTDIDMATPNGKYSGGNVTIPALTMNTVGSGDAGVYRCVATNPAGPTTSDNDVTLAPPTDVKVTGTPSVVHNTTATLTGSYTSVLPSVTITWQKKGTNNNDYTDIEIGSSDGKYAGSNVTGSSPKLVINYVNFTDKTSYRMVVNNGVGSVSSQPYALDVTGGDLTVTTGPNVTGRVGGTLDITCTVKGPEVNNIQWKKYKNNIFLQNITIDGTRYSGGSVSTPSLTISKLTTDDAGQYQCIATNPGGTYPSDSNNKATVTINYGQFEEACTNVEICDDNKSLTCTNNKCLCKANYYHKDKICHERSGLAPSITHINSTTSQFSVYWSHPPTDYNLVTIYKVFWRVSEGSSPTDSQSVGKTVTSFTATVINLGLMSGQKYTVTVSSVAGLTNPNQTITVNSTEENVRLDPLPPGSILNSSSFTHNNLILKWTKPTNTFVTLYEVTIDNKSYNTTDSNPSLSFTQSDVFTPGKNYLVSIVTISGTLRSTAHNETIRITPTKPGPPTDVKCPTNPKDQSLLISWTAPNNPNGQIQKYIINVYQNGVLKKTVNTTNNNNNYTVDGLSEETYYGFKVQTVNDASEPISIESQEQMCQTMAGISTAPRNLSSEAASRGFQISFQKPENVKGQLAGYRILINDKNGCVQEIQVICSSCNEFGYSRTSCIKKEIIRVAEINITQTHEVSNLNPYTTYTVRVAAINGNGEGNFAEISIMTDEEAPQTPSVSKVTVKSATEVDLDWTLASPSPGNVTYTVTVMEAKDNSSEEYLNKTELQYYGFSNKEATITGLEEFWRYKFIVKAATRKGFLSSNESDVVRTKQGAPGKVRSFAVERKGNTYRAAVVQWKVPSLKDQNGILTHYKFFKNGNESSLPVTLDESAFTVNEISVEPEKTFIIEVYAINSENTNGEKETDTYFARPGPPVKPADTELVPTLPGQHQSTQTTIKIDINTDFFTNKENGETVYFGIAVCADCSNVNANLGRSSYENLPNWYRARSTGFPLYRVTNDSYVEEVKTAASGRRKRSTEVPYVIGGDNTCESQGPTSYCNGPLSPGLSYKIVLFSCTNGGCVQTDGVGPFVTKAVPESEFPVGAVVGGVVAVIVVVIIVIIAGIVVKRRRLGTTSKYTEKLETVVDLEDPVPKNIPRKRPIRLRELADKVAEKHKDSNLYFAREYEDLKTLSAKHATEMSELDSNKLKNRYVNILPFDVTRVKLQLTEDDDPSTDFINANYLPGYKSEREYIATQGPIPGTIDDFWRMIWEQNVSIIVMLTLCKEEGRVKCEMYWPENVKEPKQYGDLVVETVSCSTVNFYDFRIFKIKLGDTTRTLKHFHFLQWKDFSANVQNDVMIDFIKNVRNHIRPPDMNGPVVVHCSAGVGRTGTYCALDHLFQVIDNHDLDHTIDIFDLVLNLREHRMFMVQTEQQYIFIHDCLKDYLERKLKQEQRGDECLYENQAFVADDPAEESLYQNYSNQRTDL